MSRPTPSNQAMEEARELLGNLYCRDLDCSQETYEKKGKQDVGAFLSKLLKIPYVTVGFYCSSVIVEFFWGPLWRDIKWPFLKVACWVGLACEHPKGNRTDYGRGCGVCGKRQNSLGAWIK